MENIGQHITQYIKGKVPKQLFEEFSENYIPYLSPDYLRGKAKPEFWTPPNGKTVFVEEGEVIVLWDGSNAGEVFVSKRGILSSTMVKLEFNDTLIDRKYYLYSFQFLEYILKAKTAGSGIPHVDKGIIKNLNFFKPPKHEQSAIASLIYKVDEAILAAGNSIKAAEKLKKALMQNLLTGKLKPDGTWRKEDEFKAIEKYGAVPLHWKFGKLGDIAEIIAGQSPTGDTYNEEGKGMPMLNGPTEFTDYYPTPIQYTTKPTKICKVGDILFTVRGSSTGRMNFADQEYCIGRGIAAIRANEDSDIDFLYYTLIRIAHIILAEAKGSGSTFPNVNRGELMKKKIIYPILKNEQAEIGKRIRSIENNIRSKQFKIHSLQRLKKSLMQNLLTGKVRLSGELINQLQENS